MSQKIIPVIMAGGKGTRLWPLSRSSAPKQFIQVAGDRTLFQATLLRVADRTVYEAPVVITNQDFRFLVAEQARDIGMSLSGILLEPVARNTAPAVAAACAYLGERFGDDALLQLLASDHEIDAGDAYMEAIRIARDTALADRIVTFGIAPTEPATGYGYIELGDLLPTGARALRRFVEKPPLEKAEAMLAAGGFSWNSGIFMCRVGLLVSELKRFAPAVLDAAVAAVEKAHRDLDFVRLDPESFGGSPDISIDYAVMEKTENAAVVPSAFAWSDLGSWDAVWKLGAKDEAGNVVLGNATLINAENSLVVSRAGHHLAVQGVRDMAVIASEDAVYVGRLEDSQEVGKLVKRLAAEASTARLTESHPTSYRPWGGFTSLLDGDRFQVNRLFVLPGKRLSLQRHHHRAEHWICVKGVAEVTIGDSVRLVRENESIFIPQGEVHRLHNPGKILLEMVEVQTGAYLGQDDIIRLEDDYGREKA
ncbi:mannose-1-phosphate guanylyltransferase/mannose-6-phosphate isomerase [Rhizobium sp. CSW-27]|uniref:mannose-1-phosphate guanylyltransferase/mannose-6-phosphate isomerase n=1 Tax=Rhizobium sp. CSW-27 TaxID=2839985 RepID=UPI001C0315E1|nr:mannose-1-phosphate guanylyltransferase/mannose-6-phosphate isomerase [Rhizobium sp. CSW-27]MBT9371833.1 mannose-1-phosphate guanylyltransferase/mannose-6-phosphate isomerase [Rhizobium sp. CSW-27]